MGINSSQRKNESFAYRYLMACLLFIAIATTYTTRVDLSIAIVAMVNKNQSDSDSEVFDWDSATQSTILSAFSWVYMVSQVPSGFLIQLVGAKTLLLVTLMLSSFAALLTPLVATTGGWQGMCALRALQGFSQGPIYPAVHAILSTWIPFKERAFTAGAVYAGGQFGTIITLATGGILANSNGGWPSIFYVFGSLGLAWCILWLILASSTPTESKFTTLAEKEYISGAIPGQATKKDQMKTPWWTIAKSKHVWAIFAANGAQYWGSWTLTNEIPSYMESVLGFDLEANGILSALPFFVMCILGFIFGFVADLLINRKVLSVTWCRKLFNTIGLWIPAISLIALGYVGKGQEALGVTLLVIAVGFNAGSNVGFLVNLIDLSPNFASTLIALTNGLTSFMAIIGPLMVSVIVKDKGSTSQWRIVFWIAGVIYFIGNAIFIAFATADIQPWNDPEFEKPMTSKREKLSDN